MTDVPRAPGAPSPARAAARAAAVAAVLSVAAFALKLVFRDLGLPGVFLAFFPAIFLSAWWGGRTGGWAAVVLTTIGAGYHLWTASGPGPAGLPALVALALFAAVGALVVTLTARLQLALAIRDLVLGVAAHDLKQPLATAKLQVSMLRKSLSQADPELQALERQIDRVLLLVNNLLDLPVTARGPRPDVSQDVDLVSIVRAAAQRFAPDLARRGCELRLSLDEAPQRGRWDTLALERILDNLLSNAIKYGRGRPIEIAVDGDDEVVRLVVRDHGDGLTPWRGAPTARELQRIVAQDRTYTSHGLGLYIVKRLVDEHGGRLAVQARAGEGTAFTVELPRRGAGGATASTIDPSLAAGRG